MRAREPRATDRLDRARELEIARAGWEGDRALRDELGSYESTTWDCGYYAARPSEPTPAHMVSWLSRVEYFRSTFSTDLGDDDVPESVVQLASRVSPGTARVSALPDWPDDRHESVGLDVGEWHWAGCFVSRMEDGDPTPGPDNARFAAFAWNYLLAAIAKQQEDAGR